MSSVNSARASEPEQRPQLGFYSLTSGQTLDELASKPAEFRGAKPRQLYSSCAPCAATADILKGIECVIADMRDGAEQVLRDCQPMAAVCPVIVLVDSDQDFPDGYPFGTYVTDVTTTDELGKAVFWHRVERAVRSYEQPLSLEDVNNPIVSIFRAIADQASDWIIIKDLKHRFVVAGKNFADCAGAPIDEIIGRDDLEIGGSVEAVMGDPDNGNPGFWAQDEAATNSGIASVEENPEWLLYSSDVRYRRTYRVPLKNAAGKVYALLVCSQDITDQHRNEQLLDERTSMLEQVTAEKQRAELNRQIAEDAVAAKTRFLAAASHDLRQPLHAMGLFLDSLDRRLLGSNEHHLVQQIKQSCSSLGTLFNSCLDISRLDAGVVERQMEHVSAAEFLEGLDEEFRRQTREKSLDYRLTVDDSVIYSDQMLLTRIVRNLLNNAVQNTEQGYLSIECHGAGARINLSVVDSGSGIAAEELERVYDEFHQVDKNDARRGRGLGLGLSIVKRLCELLEITISLDSHPGIGTRFTLSIPAGELANIEYGQSVQQVSLPEELIVLIVDDDHDIRYGMKALLESFGCQTVCAADAKSAIEALQTDKLVPDIVVADYHLSHEATGTQAIAEVRRFMGETVPAILVTGDTATRIECDAANHGVSVLNKPVNSDELLATIYNEVTVGV